MSPWWRGCIWSMRGHIWNKMQRKTSMRGYNWRFIWKHIVQKNVSESLLELYIAKAICFRNHKEQHNCCKITKNSYTHWKLIFRMLLILNHRTTYEHLQTGTNNSPKCMSWSPRPQETVSPIQVGGEDEKNLVHLKKIGHNWSADSQRWCQIRGAVSTADSLGRGCGRPNNEEGPRGRRLLQYCESKGRVPDAQAKPLKYPHHSPNCFGHGGFTRGVGHAVWGCEEEASVLWPWRLPAMPVRRYRAKS